jgi:hypothetical protein
MDKKRFTNDFIKNQLLQATSRKRFFNAKKFYWDCILSYGDKYYDSKLKPESESDTEEDLYRFFEQPEEETVQKFCESCGSKLNPDEGCKICNLYASSIPLGYKESENITKGNIYGFNRTFIGPLGDASTKSGNRLSELQTWVTADPKEMELKAVSEIIEGSLEFLGLGDSEQIRKTAINMYFNIMGYYSAGNELHLGANKGDLKKGYILYCIYFSLVYNKKQISIEKVLRSIRESRSSYLPQAKENILKIFQNVPGYEFLVISQEPLYVTNLCNLMNLLPRNIITSIIKVKNDLIGSGLFPNELNSVQIAACIYYVCNDMQQKRLEIILPETGKTSKITQSLLSSKCGSFAPATLTKQVNIIHSFYQRIN